MSVCVPSFVSSSIVAFHIFFITHIFQRKLTNSAVVQGLSVDLLQNLPLDVKHLKDNRPK